MKLRLWNLFVAAVLIAACSSRQSNPPASTEPPSQQPGSVTAPAQVASPSSPLHVQGLSTSRCPPATGPVTAGIVNGTFKETFDGAPAEPTPWCPPNWDIAVHSRDTGTWDTLDAMDIQHGPDCAPPPATHHSDSYAGAVHQCKDHVMTAINAEGYGAIYLTPGVLADFSKGQATIKFDVSTLRTSTRDWIDLWITPFDENLQLPLEDWLPDLQGPPRSAVQVRMDNSNGQTFFRAEVYRNFEEQDVAQRTGAGYETVLTPSATTRTPFEVDISRTHIRVGIPEKNLWWVDSDIPDLGFDTGVVQFGHHSYNPTKACDYDGSCGPDTWHWDNISIGPAVPFTIIHADQRFIAGDSVSHAVSFGAVAPANAHLRFAAIGKVELSFDGGVNWQPAQRQAQTGRDDEHFSSYWTPVPQGTASVQVRLSGNPGGYSGPYRAQDFAIWSPNPG